MKALRGRVIVRSVQYKASLGTRLGRASRVSPTLDMLRLETIYIAKLVGFRDHPAGMESRIFWGANSYARLKYWVAERPTVRDRGPCHSCNKVGSNITLFCTQVDCP